MTVNTDSLSCCYFQSHKGVDQEGYSKFSPSVLVLVSGYLTFPWSPDRDAPRLRGQEWTLDRFTILDNPPVCYIMAQILFRTYLLPYQSLPEASH